MSPGTSAFDFHRDPIKVIHDDRGYVAVVRADQPYDRDRALARKSSTFDKGEDGAKPSPCDHSVATASLPQGTIAGHANRAGVPGHDEADPVGEREGGIGLSCFVQLVQGRLDHDQAKSSALSLVQ